MKWSIPSTIIELGRDLIKENRVLKVIPDYDQERWHAEVLDNAIYTVSLDGTAKEEDICHCETWQKKGFCPHTVAVELFLKENGVIRVMQFNQKKDFVYPANVLDEFVSADQFYSEYMQHLGIKHSEALSAAVQPLKVIFEIHDELTTPFALSVDKLFYLRIKVGNQSTYYITDLAEFFELFSHAGQYTLPNRDHTKVWLIEAAFEKAVYHQLVQLAQYHQSQHQWLNTVHVASTKKMRQRLYLNKDQFETLVKFSEQQQKSVRFYIDESRQQPQIMRQQKPVAFSLATQSNGNYAISMAEGVQWYEHYQVIYDGQDLYMLEADHEYFQDILFLTQKFAESQFTLDFNAEELEQFLMLFGQLMLTKTAIDNLDILPEPIIQTDYFPELIIGVEVKQIKISVLHHYGQYIVADDPVTAKLPDDGLLLRQLRQELGTELLLTKDGFVQKSNDFVQEFDSLTALMQHLEQLLKIFPKHWQVSYEKTLQQWQAPSMPAKIEVKPTRQNRYLTIDFSIEDVEPDEVSRILTAIENDEEYFALKDGRIINVQETFSPKQNQMLEQLRKQNQGWQNGGAIPLYQSVLYADALEGQVDFEQFYRDLTHPNRDDYQPSELLQTELANYQLYAVQWLNKLAKYQLGGLLADEMGLGKTVQTIAFLLDFRVQYPESKVLILAPASVLYNWQHEIKRFAPSLKTAVIDGTIDERHQLRGEEDANIWISSYHSYRNDQETYQRQFFDVLILDEAQAIKNDRSQLYRSLSKQDAGMRIGLSGTPLENNLQEFWALMQIILPGLLPEKKIYSQMGMAAIRKLISPFVLRRSKDEVDLALPQKAIHDKFSSLATEQKNIYVAYLSDIRSRLESQKNANHEIHFELLSAITRLRQICCHPKLINPDYTGESGKFEHFKIALDRALTNGKRILIFSQFTKMLDIIEDYLNDQKITSFRITGKTNKMARQDHVDQFNAGENSVFLISLRAGGVGINLTGADTIFLYDLWWNPAVEEQAIGRAHRIGQTKDIQVYRFITEGTIEERIAELQTEKRNLFDELFNADSKNIRQQLTTEDLRYILGIGESTQ